ncbi:MAG: Crp/Fnr family transcriptional regulator [Ruminococcaceae bacterium]|nr:Crp/Fnr family transcriptional regulator [Oscillospiraceae bacterium]
MKKYLEILKKCPLFDKIDDESLVRMLTCLGGRVVSFDKKYTVFAEGARAKYIGILLSGSVQIIQVDYYGNRNILSVIRAGEVFAEAFACAEVDSLPVTVIADEPSEVMLIDSSHILHTCSNNCGFHQQLIYNLMKDLASKTIMFHQRIEITSKRTTREKLLSYLNMQSKSAGSREFVIPFDRQELADYLEVDRSGLSVEIGKLRREGIIENKKNHFVIL